MKSLREILESAKDRKERGILIEKIREYHDKYDLKNTLGMIYDALAQLRDGHGEEAKILYDIMELIDKNYAD